MYLKSECITKMTYKVRFCPENPLSFCMLEGASADFSESFIHAL